MIAADRGCAPAVQALLLAGVGVDSRGDGQFCTEFAAVPLYLAAQSGHTVCCALLLDHGADPNGATAGRGATALLVAAYGGHLECCRLLLERGAHPNGRTVNALITPLFLAAQGKRVGVGVGVGVGAGGVEGGEREALVVQIMLPPTRMSLRTCLTLAYTHIPSLFLFLALAISTSRTHVRTHASRAEGQTAVIELLVQRQANVDATTLQGVTPLIMATRQHRLEAVEILLKLGVRALLSVSQARRTCPLFASAVSLR
jgi:ankyrin repeat protein